MKKHKNIGSSFDSFLDLLNNPDNDPRITQRRYQEESDAKEAEQRPGSSFDSFLREIFPDLLNNPDNDLRIIQRRYEDWHREQVELDDHQEESDTKEDEQQ